MKEEEGAEGEGGGYKEEELGREGGCRFRCGRAHCGVSFGASIIWLLTRQLTSHMRHDALDDNHMHN